MTQDHAVLLFGKHLIVTGYELAAPDERRIIDRHLDDAARIPATIVRRVIAAGLQGVFIGAGRVADLDSLADLAGYSEYDDVAGVYDRNRKCIVVGTRGVDPTDVPHDFWHEFGHAVGDLLLLNDHFRVGQMHSNPGIWMRLHPSLRGHYPGAPLGRRESFAESFRDRLLDRSRAVRIYGAEYVGWLDEELGV